jgi:hypothetical protein
MLSSLWSLSQGTLASMPRKAMCVFVDLLLVWLVFAQTESFYLLTRTALKTSSLTPLVATPLLLPLWPPAQTFFLTTSLQLTSPRRTRSINPNCATFITIGFTVFGSFNKELCALIDRFTTTIFEQEQDSFCRSLSSIRKYYLNLWSTMCLSMSAAFVTKARLVSSRTYCDHAVNWNYMQVAS